MEWHRLNILLSIEAAISSPARASAKEKCEAQTRGTEIAKRAREPADFFTAKPFLASKKWTNSGIDKKTIIRWSGSGMPMGSCCL